MRRHGTLSELIGRRDTSAQDQDVCPPHTVLCGSVEQEVQVQRGYRGRYPAVRRVTRKWQLVLVLRSPMR